MKKNKLVYPLIGLISISTIFFSACTSKLDSNVPVQLENHMTQEELSRVSQTDFMLLDKPWENYQVVDDNSEYGSMENRIVIGSEYGAIVNGTPCFNALPPRDYSGGAGEVHYYNYDATTGVSEDIVITFENFDELRVKLRERYDELIDSGFPGVVADAEYENLISLYEAVISGEAEYVDNEVIDNYMEHFQNSSESITNDDSFYWEMDEDDVDSIKDKISEYHFYDAELDMNFVVHVTIPSAYDSNAFYPALVMTDAVWRFNDVPSLYQEFENGNANPQLLITIGFEYDVDGWDNEIRSSVLCDKKKEFLDFITDNLMPYLGREYNIDYSNSTLMGHSQGGVFTHYAAFNYDLYENRPFHNYIIGSPTFWTPYFTDVSDYEDYKNEYGFFDRNETYECQLVITGGSNEDQDYQEYYGDNDSTLEGINHLVERLDEHNVTTYRIVLYDSNHYQYVREMLVDFVMLKLL